MGTFVQLDLLFDILPYLNVEMLASCRYVSKNWNAFIQNNKKHLPVQISLV